MISCVTHPHTSQSLSYTVSLQLHLAVLVVDAYTSYVLLTTTSTISHPWSSEFLLFRNLLLLLLLLLLHRSCEVTFSCHNSRAQRCSHFKALHIFQLNTSMYLTGDLDVCYDYPIRSQKSHCITRSQQTDTHPQNVCHSSSLQACYTLLPCNLPGPYVYHTNIMVPSVRLLYCPSLGHLTDFKP